MTAVKAVGLQVMSTDGVAQPSPPNFKGALIADPNNFFLTAFAPCDGCAPDIAALGRQPPGKLAFGPDVQAAE